MTRARQFNFFALPVFVLAVVALLVGAYARQIEARTVCPDWPECYRSAPALTANVEPASAAGFDITHNITEGALLLALAGLAFLGWKRRQDLFDRHWRVPAFALTLAGSATVTRLADGGTIGAWWQQLAALGVLLLLWWLIVREGRFVRPTAESAMTRALRPRVVVAFALVFMAAALGGWASVHGIGLPCPEFPACRGEWWPAGSLLSVLTVPDRPDLAGATALAISHRLGALVALIYVLWLGLHVWRVGVRDHLCRYGMLVLATLLVATGLGIMGAVTRLPPITAVAHSAAAALLLLSLVTLYHVARPATRPEKRGT